jgi:hypothetical protein
MKKLTFIIFFSSLYWLSSIAQAQDFIVLQSGDSIKAKVEEVGVTEIKYKRFNLLDGPIYIILKSDVKYIRYSDGSRDIFSEKKIIPEINNLKAKPKVKQKENFWNLFFGMSVPLSEFADKEGGAAKDGFILGLEGTTLIDAGGAFFSYQASFAINKYQSYFSANGFAYEANGDYSILHLLIGLGYRSRPATEVFYFELSAGINYTSLSGTLVQFGYDDASAGAFSIAGGMKFSKNLNAGLGWYTSTPKFKNKHGNSFDAEQKITLLRFTIGYEF